MLVAASTSRNDESALPKGFTLLEVLMALLIMGMIAVAAAPRFSGFVARQHVDAAVRRVMADISLARHRAKMTGTAHKVDFVLSNDTYLLPEMFDPNGSGEIYSVELAEDPYSVSIESVDLGGDMEIVFDGFGLPDSGGTTTIGFGSFFKSITIDAETGRVTVSDWLDLSPPPPPKPPMVPV